MIIFWGIMLPFFGTLLGASFVFFMKGKLNPAVNKALLGAASGIMVAASVWSLLIPSIEMSEHLMQFAFFPAAAGFFFGILFLLFLDKVIFCLEREKCPKKAIKEDNRKLEEFKIQKEKENLKQKDKKNNTGNKDNKAKDDKAENDKVKNNKAENDKIKDDKAKNNKVKDDKTKNGKILEENGHRKVFLLVLTIILHNIPEGMAVGAAFAGSLSSHAVLAGALALSLGIAIQNIPEGAIVSMPLRGQGMNCRDSFFYGVLSGAVEPVGAGLTLLLVGRIQQILPFLLSFAAGCMIYVVVQELIPEAVEKKESFVGILSFSIGFLLMMILDVAL